MSQKHDRAVTDFQNVELRDALGSWRGEVYEQLLVDLRCGGPRCFTRIGLVSRCVSDDPRDGRPVLVVHAQHSARDDPPDLRGHPREGTGPGQVWTAQYLLTPDLPALWCRAHGPNALSLAVLHRKVQDALAAETDGEIIPKKLTGTPMR